MNRTGSSKAGAALVLVGCALALASTEAAAQEARPPQPITPSEVRAGITLLTSFPDGNMLVVRGGAGVLLVDAHAPAHAVRVDSVVRATAGAAPTWVVNTHYHADHIGANARFAQAGATLIAQRRMPVLAARDTTIPELEWDLDPADPAALPAQLVDDSLRLDLGGETALLIHMPRAHTGGDLVVRLVNANVLHTGDIVEFGAYPFIDWWSGGSYDGLLAATDRILTLCDDATTIIPGHGPPLTRGDVLAYREMLATVGAQVRRAVETDTPRDSLEATRPTARWDERHGGERQGRRFVRLLHHEFTNSGK